MTIGSRIKSVRKSMTPSLTQKQLAKKIGVAQSLIAYLESGVEGGSVHTASIARALGVNAHWLETGEGKKEIDPISMKEAEKNYSQEIINVIRLMESLDERGQRKALIAVEDAVEAHRAQKASLPLPHVRDEDRVQDPKKLNEHAKRESDRLLPKAVAAIRQSSDVYIADKKLAEDQSGKRH